MPRVSAALSLPAAGLPDQRATRWSCHKVWPATSLMAAWASSKCRAARRDCIPWVAGTRALAASTSFYAADHPRYWSLWNNTLETPWADLGDVLGAVVRVDAKRVARLEGEAGAGQIELTVVNLLAGARRVVPAWPTSHRGAGRLPVSIQRVRLCRPVWRGRRLGGGGGGGS